MQVTSYQILVIYLCLSLISCQNDSTHTTNQPIVSQDMSEVDALMVPTDQGLVDQSMDQMVDQFQEENLGACELPDRVQIRRLSRYEYQKSLQSIFFQLADHVAQDLPEDGIGYGFDQIGEVLSTSPLHLEKYNAILDDIFAQFYQTGLLAISQPAKTLKHSQGATYRSDAWQYWADAQAVSALTTYFEGKYLIRAKTQNIQPRLVLSQKTVDQESQMPTQVEIPVTDAQLIDGMWVWEVNLSAKSAFEVKLIIDPSNSDPNQKMILEELQFLGPIQDQGQMQFVRDMILPCRFQAKENFLLQELKWIKQQQQGNQNQPRPSFQEMTTQQEQEKYWTCISESTIQLAQKAWRKTITTEEKNRLLSWLSEQIANHSSWEEAFSMISKAIILSPQFSFRAEDPSRTILSDEEIASRISYFLWSSPPDEQLLSLAHQGALRNPQQRRMIASQMLNHPNAISLIDSFADQWLHIRNMKNVAPDGNYFPDFDDQLRHSMEIEAKLLFAELLSRNAPLDELLESQYRLIDQRLAQHYQLDWQSLQTLDIHANQPADEMNFFDRYIHEQSFIKLDLSQVDQASTLRKGFLGIGAFLTISSMPTRTSPVKRGKWVLEQLLCSEPPPPPPNVEATLSNDNMATTLREKLEQHRADPSCAGCHKLMDPIGLSLEKFDGIGKFREMDNGYMIDDSGELIDGTRFKGVEELSNVVVTDPRYHRCFLEKLYIFALGRGNQRNDECILDDLEQKIAVNGFKINDFILGIIESDAFVMQKTDLE